MIARAAILFGLILSAALTVACGDAAPSDCPNCEPEDPTPGPVHVNGSFEDSASWTFGSAYSINIDPAYATNGQRSLHFSGTKGAHWADSPEFTAHAGRTYSLSARALSAYNDVRVGIQWFSATAEPMGGLTGVLAFSASYCLDIPANCWATETGTTTAPNGAATGRVEVVSSPAVNPGYPSHVDEVALNLL